jgi:hypothetical protein
LPAQPLFDTSGTDPLTAAPDLPAPAGHASGEPELRVHVDPDAMLRDSLAVGIAAPDHHAGPDRRGDPAAGRHGADDGRRAARRNSDRARSGRAAGAGGGRSYAFRRS